MPAWHSHCSSESGVFSGCRPLAISTSLPCPSWSVFDQWKHNGDPLGVGLEVFAADCSQFRPPQASGKPDHDQGLVPGRRQGTTLHDIHHPPDELEVTAALPSCSVPVALRMPAYLGGTSVAADHALYCHSRCPADV